MWEDSVIPMQNKIITFEIWKNIIGIDKRVHIRRHTKFRTNFIPYLCISRWSPSFQNLHNGIAHERIIQHPERTINQSNFNSTGSQFKSFIKRNYSVKLTASWCCRIASASSKVSVVGPIDFLPKNISNCLAACSHVQEFSILEQSFNSTDYGCSRRVRLLSRWEFG